MKRLMSLLISGVLVAGSAGAALAQKTDRDRDRKDSVKQTTKDVAHDTKRAAKATGKAVAKGTKKVIHKGANVTRKGAEAVEDKTKTKK